MHHIRVLPLYCKRRMKYHVSSLHNTTKTLYLECFHIDHLKAVVSPSASLAETSARSDNFKPDHLIIEPCIFFQKRLLVPYVGLS